MNNEQLKSNKIVSFFEDDELTNGFAQDKPNIKITPLSLFDGKAAVINNLLSDVELDLLLKSYSESTVEASKTGNNGYVGSYKDGEKVHSLRKTLFSDKLADILYNRIKDSLVEVEYENKKYTPIGINPAFRFIEYMDNGYLVPHYDFPYVKNDKELTLKSMVINLLDSSAKTLFVKDSRPNFGSFKDLDRPPTNDEIIDEVESKRNNVLLFDHNIFHSGSGGTKKIIIRTDVLYSEVNV